MAQEYTVKSGDTLSQIAKNFNTSISNISGYRSGNPNLIYSGEKLTINNDTAPTTTINANEITPPTNLPLPSQESYNSSGVRGLIGGEGISSQVDKYRSRLESQINSQLGDVNKRLESARGVEKNALSSIKDLSTPFRADLEKSERERLYINKNFGENQKLVDELDQLLTEGNDLIKQQQGITGLAAVRNPRIQQTMNDVAARAGVIEAVINARNGQIAVAEGLIDRSVGAIEADREQEISYYSAVIDLNNRDIITLEKDKKDLINSKLALAEQDLTQAREAANYVKELLINPDTAALMGEAGVSLNDSVESINAKLKVAQHNRDIREVANEVSLNGGVAVVDPSGIPADQLFTYKAPNGQTYYYKLPKKVSTSGDALISSEDPRVATWARMVESGQADINDVPTSLRTSVAVALGSGSGGTNGAPITFEQYLKAAEDEAQMNFAQSAVEELRTQYESAFSSNKTSAAEWALSIDSGYVDIKDVPASLRPLVVTELARTSGV